MKMNDERAGKWAFFLMRGGGRMYDDESDDVEWCDDEEKRESFEMRRNEDALAKPNGFFLSGKFQWFFDLSVFFLLLVINSVMPLYSFPPFPPWLPLFLPVFFFPIHHSSLDLAFGATVCNQFIFKRPFHIWGRGQ